MLIKNMYIMYIQIRWVIDRMSMLVRTTNATSNPFGRMRRYVDLYEDGRMVDCLRNFYFMFDYYLLFFNSVFFGLLFFALPAQSTCQQFDVPLVECSVTTFWQSTIWKSTM